MSGSWMLIVVSGRWMSGRRSLRSCRRGRRRQVVELADAIDPRFWALVRLCGFCGLRQGEALALRPGDVDWLGRRIRVDWTLNLRTQVREEPKSVQSRRWVTMPSVVADALSRHVKEYPSDGWVFHNRGEPWRASRVWEAWD